MKLKDNVSNSDLSEIGHGPIEASFAYVNPDKETTITPFCRCKDYFNDMFWSNKMKTDINILGFKWKHGEDGGVLDRPTLKLGIRLTKGGKTGELQKQKEEQLKGILDLLNKIESANGWNLAEGEITEDGNYIILSFDPSWTSKPYINSAFYFFIRLGFTYDSSKDLFEQFQDQKHFLSRNDVMYLRNGESRIKDLLAGKIDNSQTYEQYNSSTIHSSSGLIGYKEYKI